MNEFMIVPVIFGYIILVCFYNIILIDCGGFNHNYSKGIVRLLHRTVVGYFVIHWLYDKLANTITNVKKMYLFNKSEKLVEILSVEVVNHDILSFDEAKPNLTRLKDVIVHYRYVDLEIDKSIIIAGELSDKLIAMKDAVVGSKCRESELIVASCHSTLNSMKTNTTNY